MDRHSLKPPDGAAPVGPVPILSPDGGEVVARPAGRADRGVSAAVAQDALTVRAEHAGWARIRVPWDSDWGAAGAAPGRMGGPGHLVAWAQQGATEM